jgi:hypothetical protein
MILAQVQPPADILQLLPTRYTALATSIFLILTTLGRIVTALKNDPSFMGAIKSVFMGSSATTQSLPNNSDHVPVVAVPPGDKTTAMVLTPSTPVTSKMTKL